jgi:sialate O-acetylesterase
LSLFQLSFVCLFLLEPGDLQASGTHGMVAGLLPESGMRVLCYILLYLVFAFALPARAVAAVQLPNLFSDHAVVQRDRPIRIWGWGQDGEMVTIRFHGQTVTAATDPFGNWEAWLKPESAGGPYTLAVSSNMSTPPIERKDILIGDVWLASGQSNMEFPLAGFTGANPAPLKDGEKEIATANQPRIRLLLQKRTTSTVPLTEASDGWTECTPDTARQFSAIAYFFGREISEREKVPVGLIDSTWGGTPAHSWISPKALAAANLTSVFEDAGTIAEDQGRADQIKAYYAREDAALQGEGKPAASHARITADHGGAWVPGTLFNAMIAPYTRFTIKGVLWYQGETDSDARRAPYYVRVFPTLISDWRQQWGEGDFPFLFVQISSFHSTAAGWPTVRDAQRRTLSLRHTGMAVTLDVGTPENVHPPDKQTVAHRLALAARAEVYGEDVEYSSPEFLQATTEPNAMRVWFTHAQGLTSHDQEVGGFEVAGDDHNFVPATARIEKVGESDTVLVSCPKVQFPRFVRYDWSGVVTTYLYNRAGLPAGTFTSE